MLERNQVSHPTLQAQLSLAARSKRKRNRILLFIILALTAALLWKVILSFDPYLPNNDPIEAPPVTALHPIVFIKQTELIAETSKAGITILVTDGFRSSEEQNAIYAKGRTTEGKVVTQVQGGHSYHNYGLAVDFALRTKKGEVIWDMEYDGNKNGRSDWMEVVEIAKRLGFSWGGDWKNFPDYPHLQMDFGYSINKLRKGHYPPVE
ncbi:M15 family metallopeptidase [Paenibacillus sp. FSL A5-0031]|uniref:M15 family metallopeptidase n=1 Tax=Paenibacillus sp. FSL A5-0031 TaxID=1920420 RepID=UPI0009F91659|nr:M15 family metallopeptidase [Paenibacillus sp. FSL A5-0031]